MLASLLYYGRIQLISNLLTIHDGIACICFVCVSFISCLYVDFASSEYNCKHGNGCGTLTFNCYILANGYNGIVIKSISCGKPQHIVHSIDFRCLVVICGDANIDIIRLHLDRVGIFTFQFLQHFIHQVFFSYDLDFFSSVECRCYVR